MSNSVSKYYDDLEQKEWFENKAKESISRFGQLKSFIFKMFSKC